MSAKEKKTKTTKRGRVEVKNLDSQKPGLNDKDLKQVKGGADGGGRWKIMEDLQTKIFEITQDAK